MASTSNEFVQQFKILAKSTSGKATAAIVEQVIKHKQIYMFGEILDLPCVQNVRHLMICFLFVTFAVVVKRDGK